MHLHLMAYILFHKTVIFFYISSRNQITHTHTRTKKEVMQFITNYPLLIITINIFTIQRLKPNRYEHLKWAQTTQNKTEHLCGKNIHIDLEQISNVVITVASICSESLYIWKYLVKFVSIFIFCILLLISLLHTTSTILKCE